MVLLQSGRPSHSIRTKQGALAYKIPHVSGSATVLQRGCRVPCSAPEQPDFQLHPPLRSPAERSNCINTEGLSIMVYLMLQALNLNWELKVASKLEKPSDNPEPGFGYTLYWHAGLEQAKDCHPVYHFSKLFNQWL